MRRVAVFGNAGAGKSTLARQLAELTGLPLHVIDKMQFKTGGAAVAHEEYLTAHADLLSQDEWIIDGYGTTATAFERFARADTLVYVDPPLAVHYWFVTKRFIKGLFAAPEGWPDHSPLWSSTMQSYKVIPLCHSRLTPKYRQVVVEAAVSKRVHHLRSRADIAAFLDAVRREVAGSSL
jgi:adenylate kinase family enzyme